MDLKNLLRLIEDDEYGILSIKATKSKKCNSNDRLISSFKEINKFILENERLPEASKDVQEYKLYQRLEGIKFDENKINELREYDEFGLLTSLRKFSSLDDILNDKEADFLKDDENGIFELKHVPKALINIPDYIAKRKPCTDFEKYEGLFKQCQYDLSIRKREILPFSKQIEKEHFFILKGVLLYIAEVGPTEVINGHTNARLRCIYENGTESDVLMRSLAAELYKDGRLVTEHQDHLLAGFNSISPEDKEAGYIYVVNSLSVSRDIHSIANLYKIGFSKTPVVERIKNAHRDPTFLMAPVELIACYKCFNLNPQKLELLLHRFFGKVCLDIDIYDAGGTRHIPREWFVVPLGVIEQVIQFIQEESIDKYRYDAHRQEILPKEELIMADCPNGKQL